MTRLPCSRRISPAALFVGGRNRLSLLCLCATLTLAGCASTDPVARQDLLNQSQAQVQQIRGTPLAVYAVDGKSHWFYPMGSRDDSARELLVFDAAGLLIAQRPAWTREAFTQIQIEQDGHLELLQAFGPPLRQGVQPRSLLRAAAEEESTTAAAPPNAPYWQYAFRERHQDFYVHILFSDDRKVSEVRIFQDPAADRLLSP
ncbi:hypothetical protein SAMN02745117_02323 [Lampropedia hyalina DSM 16112]|jgi:hypothetical protein|uniref:SmpA / OmlA family protein n=1 Tax=Lampropedia hyalina DSM 16112 TaxID=1122156 RepID=A0A1M5D6Z8_9BURK|nr:hypothetical protein [Lampropedia hyalina]SHF62819.1 hypothetical protein SAMN02745117_02323 [Lampropedia hyalina DSM 16112]